MLKCLTFAALSLLLGAPAIAGPQPPAHEKPDKQKPDKRPHEQPDGGSTALLAGTYATTLTFRGDTCPLPPSYTPIGEPASGKMEISSAGADALSFDLPAAFAYFPAAMTVNVPAEGYLSFVGPLRFHIPAGNSDMDTNAALQGSYSGRSFVLAGPLRVGDQCAIDITLEGSFQH